MKNPMHSLHFHKTRQRGSAAVEAAFVLPILILFLSFPIFYARCCWHYTVAQKAAQDATRFLASVSATEMKSKTSAAAAGAAAIQLAKMEIAELAPGSQIADPTAYCDDVLCGLKTSGTLPSTVKVYISFDMYDTFAGVIYTQFGIPITADVTMTYVGN